MLSSFTEMCLDWRTRRGICCRRCELRTSSFAGKLRISAKQQAQFAGLHNLELGVELQAVSMCVAKSTFHGRSDFSTVHMALSFLFTLSTC